MAETFDELVARVNSHAFIPPADSTGAIMASKVKLAKGKEFHFNVTGGHVASKYPWDSWFEGDLMLLERSSGEENEKGTIVKITEKRDYEVPTQGMPPKIKTAARRRYKVVQVSHVDVNGDRLKDSLIIQARDMTPEERAEEDELRIVEREELRAKKAAAKVSANGTGQQHASTPQEQEA